MLERIFSQERTRLEKSVISNYLSNEKIYDEIKVSNKFAGIIGKINLYESEFDKSKIKDLFLSPFNVQKSSETIDIIENKEVENHLEEKEHEDDSKKQHKDNA